MVNVREGGVEQGRCGQWVGGVEQGRCGQWVGRLYRIGADFYDLIFMKIQSRIFDWIHSLFA